jgi:cytochrome P450
VEELMRFNPVIFGAMRMTIEDVEFGGVPIQAGTFVLVNTAAGNRDPEVFDDPHRFDITRTDTHHHSFGGGAHFCLGAPLARLEAQIAVSTLVRRFPNIRLGDEPVVYRKLPSFRGLAKFPVLV